MVGAVLALAALTMLLKGAGSLAREIPEPIANRLAGLATALLAALVAVELTGDRGIPQLDEKAAGVAVAVVLARRKAPFAVCIIAAAAVAALLRFVL
ncbi:MAG TPA: AzlD domain-containing protein [Acidimicrobiales bacterium]|jgi:hypothetical protein|nr:AzlD domain-containing protein [Acidimicrobiales bacterium]